MVMLSNSQQSLGFQWIMMEEANTYGWHIVWITLSAIIAISISAALDAHSSSWVVGSAEKVFFVFLSPIDISNLACLSDSGCIPSVQGNCHEQPLHIYV